MRIFSEFESEFASRSPDPLPLLELTEALNTELHEKGEVETPGDCGIERLKRKASGGGGEGYTRENGHEERK